MAMRRRPLFFLAVPALVLIYFFSFTGKRSSAPFTYPPTPPSEALGTHAGLENCTDDFDESYEGPRVRQATMLYEGDKDKLRGIYERCVATHRNHGDRWGVPTHVLGHSLYEDNSFFNKPAYLQSLIMVELAKPVAKRADWVVWFDGDSVIMNPEIPWTIFLPPTDLHDYHILGTQDNNGFNAGMLILRVDQWTVRTLSQVLALPVLQPSVNLPFFDQSALDWVFQLPANQEHFIFQPRHWWNRYFFTGDGDQPGEMLLHFAGIGAQSGGGSQEKSAVMRRYLEKAETEAQSWTKDISKTPYEKETKAFWDDVRNAKETLQKTGKWFRDHPANRHVREVQEAEKVLRETLLREADKVDWLSGNTTQLQKLLRD
ncbi:hypothetical protein BDR22DRAFT_893653 [Usnea florida]